MWIFTQFGYVSVVQNTDPSPGAELVVRARTRRHLEQVLSLALPADQARTKIWPTPGEDYPWRALVDRDVVRDLTIASVEALDYGCFKRRAADTLGRFDARVLGDIWGVSHHFAANENANALQDGTGRIGIVDSAFDRRRSPCPSGG